MPAVTSTTTQGLYDGSSVTGGTNKIPATFWERWEDVVSRLARLEDHVNWICSRDVPLRGTSPRTVQNPTVLPLLKDCAAQILLFLHQGVGSPPVFRFSKLEPACEELEVGVVKATQAFHAWPAMILRCKEEYDIISNYDAIKLLF